MGCSVNVYVCFFFQPFLPMSGHVKLETVAQTISAGRQIGYRRPILLSLVNSLSQSRHVRGCVICVKQGFGVEALTESKVGKHWIEILAKGNIIRGNTRTRLIVGFVSTNYRIVYKKT